MRRKWVLAIKRLDPKTEKPWEPSNSHVVCRNHFTLEDYTDTLLSKSLYYNLMLYVFLDTW